MTKALKKLFTKLDEITNIGSMRLGLLGCLAIFAIQGCTIATHPNDIAPSGKSGFNYSKLSCDELFIADKDNRRYYLSLYNDQKKTHDDDFAFRAAVGFSLGALALLGLGVEGDSEVQVEELRILKRDGNEIKKAMTNKSC